MRLVVLLTDIGHSSLRGRAAGLDPERPSGARPIAGLLTDISCAIRKATTPSLPDAACNPTSQPICRNPINPVPARLRRWSRKALTIFTLPI